MSEMTPEPAESVVGMLAEALMNVYGATFQQGDIEDFRSDATFMLAASPALRARLAVAPEPTLDAAWKAAEAALPEKVAWIVLAGPYSLLEPAIRHVASAKTVGDSADPYSEARFIESGNGPTPQAALFALAEKLTTPPAADPATEEAKR